MACNCKKNVNPKYLDDTYEKLGIKKINGVEKIGNGILQFLFGVLISLILIVGLIPAIICIIYCVCTGKDMSVRIPNFYKWIKRKN